MKEKGRTIYRRIKRLNIQFIGGTTTKWKNLNKNYSEQIYIYIYI